MSDRIEELEAKLAERRQARANAEKAQYEKDLEALFDLEDEHGALATIKVARFIPGHPTRVYVKTPSAVQYKRYVDQVTRAAEKKNQKAQRDAQDLLAKSCWVYPKEEKDREAMLEEFPGILTSIVLAASALAEGKAEEEKND